MEGDAPTGRVAASAAVTTVLQLASMGIGALLALLIVDRFGKTARTDGLLAAYGVYGLVLVVAATLRTTLAAPLSRGDLPERLDRFVGGALLVVAATAVPCVLLSGPTAGLLTGDLPEPARAAAQSALVAFWLAAGAQLVVAVGAAALAVRGRFALPGAAYVLAGLVSLVVLVVLAGELGTDAAALGVAGGSLLAAVVVVAALLGAGWRPRTRRLLPSRATGAAAVVMLTGTVGLMGWQGTYLLSLAFAATLGEGSVTLYSYAFFAVGVLIATTGGSAAIVMAAPVAQGWDEDPRTLEPAILDVLRAGLTLVLPALALAALVGDDVILLLLGGVLDRADAVTIVTCILLFGPAIAEHLAGTVPGLAALARQRYGALAAIALVGIVLHAGLAAGAAATGRLEALVVAQVVAQTLMLAALLRLVHGRDAARVARLTGAEAVRYGAAGAVAWVPAGLLAGLVGGVAEQVAAFLLGCVLFAALLRLQPTRWEVARRMAGPAVALVGARRRASLAASR